MSTVQNNERAELVVPIGTRNRSIVDARIFKYFVGLAMAFDLTTMSVNARLLNTPCSYLMRSKRVAFGIVTDSVVTH